MHNCAILHLFFVGCCVIVTSCVRLPNKTLSAAEDMGTNTAVISALPQPLININTASTNELERLPGVGPGLAQRIVEHRTRYGTFRRKEHLMMVRGVGENRYREIEKRIMIEMSNE